MKSTIYQYVVKEPAHQNQNRFLDRPYNQAMQPTTNFVNILRGRCAPIIAQMRKKLAAADCGVKVREEIE